VKRLNARHKGFQAGMKVGPNERCPCGSGKKYKRCCGMKKSQMSIRGQALLILLAVMLVAGLVLMVFRAVNQEGGRPQRVWSPEHGHYHTVP